MKLSVDPSLCQGYGLCATEAPDLVELDDGGYASILGDDDVAPELVDVAEKAVAMCPAQALRLG